MARTNRKDLPPAPASVDALDDLNLDDMFQGGDDSLFDGLDIDLDGMGEITGAADDEKSSSMISKDLDAMKQNLLGPEITAPASCSSTSKRRKTKRKIKTPPALEEEDDGDDAPTKKKKRTSKLGTTKKAKSKSKPKNSTPAPSEGSASSGKSKSKARTMPPPLPRSTSSGQGMVAAAGQFGGRTQKRGAYGVPIERPTTERQKSKTKVTAPQGITKAKSAGSQSPKSARARGSGSKQQQSEAPISNAMTPEQSNFCGLLPSATIFYPFLPALPAEPSMRKCNRLYPSIDKIHSAFTSQSNSRESTSNPPSYNMATSTLKNEPLYQILEGGKDNSASAPAPTAAEMLRSAALTSSIAASRKTISQLGKSEVISDLQGICKLLSKQYEFLNQNSENMKRWCKDHFSEKDYSAVYGPLSTLAASNKKQKLLAESSGQGTGRQSGLATSRLLSGWLVKVKVKCGGFKEPKTGPLLAQLPLPPSTIQPQSAVAVSVRPPSAPPAAVKIEPSKASASKKRKIATKALSEKTSLPKSGIITPKVEVVVSYGDSKPSQRRKSIADVVARRAHLLETKYVETKERRRQALARQEAGLQEIVDDDEIAVSNTSALWKWIEQSAYFEAYTEKDIDEMLHCAWQPEMTARELFCKKVAPLQLKKREQDKSHKVSTKSLFDRLQSLLVEEGSDDEMEADDDTFLDGWQTTKSEGAFPTILDMSELTLEERTYVQLRAVGLVDGQFLPSTKPALIEEDDSSSDDSVDENGDAALSSQENGTSSNIEDNSLKDVIRTMQDDLSRLHKLTNSRTALLQSAAKAHLSVTEQSKRKKEDNIMQISRYNQLLKKQKENKRSARQKSYKKDEDWVPW